MSPTLRLFKRHHVNMILVLLIAIGGAYFACQELLPPTQQPTILAQLLPYAFGAWLADLAYVQRNRDDHRDNRIGRLEGRDDDTHRRVETLEEVASTHASVNDVVEAQKRELNANQAALQSMREVVTLKEAASVPVLPETFVAMDILERQISALRNLIDDGPDHIHTKAGKHENA